MGDWVGQLLRNDGVDQTQTLPGVLPCLDDESIAQAMLRLCCSFS